MLVTVPAIRYAHTDFLAAGAPGYGEAAPGDHLQTAYRLWLPGQRLEQLDYPWYDPYSFQPEASAQLNPAAWPFGLPFWPLWRALGIVVGWNAFLLLSLVAAGLLAYLWLRELGLGFAAALTGGLAFEVAPYRLVQSSEQLLGPISLLLPLALWTFERGRGGSRWWFLLSTAAIASIPLSGQLHLALGAIPFFLAYALVRGWRDWWAVAGAAVATALAIAAGVLLWIFTIDGTIGERGRSLRQVELLSAEWLDLVTRQARHGLESWVFLGWLTPLVALVGLALLVLDRRFGLAAVLGGGAVVPVVLALGTNTPLYEAVRFVVVPLRHARAPERLMPIACLAIAALVALAIEALEHVELPFRIPRRAVVLPVVVAVVLLADLRITAFQPTAADEDNAAYAALRAAPPGRPLELPVFDPGIHYGGVYLYYTTQARRERPGGYSTVAPVEAARVARALAPLNCGDWTAESRTLLRRLGVGRIAFHAGLYRENPAVPDTAAFAWRALVREGYRPQTTSGAVTLFARGTGAPAEPPMPEPPPGATILCDGWRPNDGTGRLLAGRHGSLWAYSSGGDLRLIVGVGRPASVAVSVDGEPAFARDVSELAEIRVSPGGEGWHLVSFDVPPGTGLRLVAYGIG